VSGSWPRYSPRRAPSATGEPPSDPERARWNQQSVSSGQLAREYGFADVDGSRPDIWRYFEATGQTGRPADLGDYR
jgi:hypothetical protein